FRPPRWNGVTAGRPVALASHATTGAGNSQRSLGNSGRERASGVWGLVAEKIPVAAAWCGQLAEERRAWAATAAGKKLVTPR
ncbi:MAG: hypothetical protein ACKOFW_17965, partial [Planctomycetaceae bacterium]